MTIRWITAAFRLKGELSDEDKLDYLGDGLGKTNAFERRELLAKELPGINAKIEEQRRHRYYQIEAWLPQHWPSNENDSRRFVFSLHGKGSQTDLLTVPFGHYDFDRKGFEIPCFYLGSDVFGNHGNQIYFDKSELAYSDRILLPVPEPSQRRTT